jgi:hypothetical protein
MFEGLKSFFTGRPPQEGAKIEAASDLPAAPLPNKVKGKQATLPSYLRTAKPSTTSPLTRTDRLLANKNILDYRASADSRDTIRDFRRASPDLAAAVTAYVRTGITSGYTAIARNMDGTINPEGTNVLQQVLARMNIMNDYTIGFDDSLSIRSLSEAWAQDLVTQGACCGELVLDKARLPDKLQPVATQQIRMFPSSDGRKLIPKQFVAGNYIDLDIPTFFMVTLDADLLEPYPISPIEPAIQAVLFSADFMNDIRRVVKRAIHPRVIVTIDEEKFKKTIPNEFTGDQEAINSYMASVVQRVSDDVNNLNPEDALVVFDTFGIEVVDHGNTSLSQEYTVLQGLADAKLAAGAKVLPTILGHAGGTSNTASAEVLMFLKAVEGSIWGKLNEMLSKMLTLAVRLLGNDVYVEFTYNAIDLRPESELEAFYALRQSRVLELLSLGMITDEEASIRLSGHLPPAGYKPLSGTNFRPNTGQVPAGDGFNGASNSGSTLNQKVKSDAPTGTRGKKVEAAPLTVVS